MSITWLLLAATLLVVNSYAHRVGGQVVRRFSHRKTRPGKKSFWYDATYFGLSFAIALPPIWLLPGSDVLVITAFTLLGVLVGSLVAQYFFGTEVCGTFKSD